MLMGFLGVFLFSLTLPATKLAIREIDPMIIGLGRGIIAAVSASGILLVTRQSLPGSARYSFYSHFLRSLHPGFY